ncbi:MAG: sugar phosphate isomerase/epimerase family protein [Promethearchaeia archaeon]
MKLSIVSGLNESTLQTEKVEEKFQDICTLLDSLGYDAVELGLLEPEKVPVDSINEIRSSYGLDISALGTGGTFIRFGYSLGHHEQKMRKKALNRIRKFCEFGAQTDSNVVIGLIRGRYSYESDPAIERKNIKNSLRKCSEIAEEFGVTLLFEPINQFEIDSFNTFEDSLALINEINNNNIKLLVDTYHTNLEENPETVWDYLNENSDSVGHIHLADTNRRAPGTGCFNFKRFLKIFKNAQFEGYISVETIMKPSFKDVAQQTVEHLKKIGIRE